MKKVGGLGTTPSVGYVLENVVLGRGGLMSASFIFLTIQIERNRFTTV